MRFEGFIGPSYTLRSVNVDCQRCVNLYPEINELGTGKEHEVASLVGTPGLLLLNAIGGASTRCVYTAKNGTLFVVIDATVYSVSSAWVATSIGTLSTTIGVVNMADDGYNLVIVDGSYGYNYNFHSTTFAKITDSNFAAASQVANQFTYFIFNMTGTNKFFLADPPSGSVTAPVAFTLGGANSNFASAQDYSTSALGIMTANLNLWLFNQKSTEVWYFSGATDFPFQIVQGAYIEYGTPAINSIAKLENTVFWVGQNASGQGQVFMANGYQPQRISNHAVEFAIQGYGDISGAIGFTYQENGHEFYVLNFGNADSTWVYDATTKMWHERVYLNQGIENRHLASGHAFAYNTHVVGDYQSGNIYSLSESTYTDNGNPILRLRAAPHMTQDMDRIFYSIFQLDAELGVGLDGSGQGTNPQAVLQFSDDGGHIWSNEKWASMGLIGQTKYRVHWHRLGQSRQRVFRVKITDPIKVILIGAKLEVTAGAA